MKNFKLKLFVLTLFCLGITFKSSACTDNGSQSKGFVVYVKSFEKDTIDGALSLSIVLRSYDTV